jgi:2-haloacid dehalogenase
MLHPVYVFDAYGTLFDVHSAVAGLADMVGERADRLSQLWRQKQLEYSWVRALTGAHRDFWSLTQEALDYAAAAMGGLDAQTRARLLSGYETLEAYPDVHPTLAVLKARGVRTAVLSNGSPPMLAKALRSAVIEPLLDAVLSVEAAGVFKTDPRTYALVTSHFGCAAEEVSFQSSNRWDVAGATKFGFRTVWVNRSAAPDEYRDLAPALVVKELTQLLE